MLLYCMLSLEMLQWSVLDQLSVDLTLFIESVTAFF